VAIIGLGLVGGSIARGLRMQWGQKAKILGVDNCPTTLDAAKSAGIFNHLSTAPDKGLSQIGLVMVCTPIHAFRQTLAQLKPYIPAEAVLSDVIGVKKAPSLIARELLPENIWVGSHPMAGGEHGGFENSRDDLFNGCTAAICPRESDAEASTSAVELVSDLWAALGATPITIGPAAHDHEVAQTSHLPYLLALALSQEAFTGGPPLLAGGGLRDATRRADFGPEVMAAVLAQNPFLVEHADRLANSLRDAARMCRDDPEMFCQWAEDIRRLRNQRAVSNNVKLV